MSAEDSDLVRFAYEPVDTIRRAPRNPKRHAKGVIHESISRFGYVDSVIVAELPDGASMLVAGHGRLDEVTSRQEAGLEAPPGIYVDDAGVWHVPVQRRRFASIDEAEAYLLVSNRSVELGGWDTDGLEAMAKDMLVRGVSFAGTGFDPDALMKQAGEAAKEKTKRKRRVVDLDEQFEPPPVPVTQSGDLWIAGPHRIYCGDSTRDGDVDKLLDGDRPVMVLEDPPYAIYGSSTGIGSDIADDRMVRPFFEAVFRQISRVLRSFGHFYVYTDWRSWAALTEAMRRGGLTQKNCIVWDKGNEGLGSMYALCHEFVMFGSKTPPPRTMKGGKVSGERTVMRPNISRHPRVTGEARNHNASKPVAQLREFIVNSSDPGGIVADFFCGGGSTLVACEAEGRICRTMDHDPKWVDAAVQRWQAVTGQEATRVPAGEGVPRRRRRKEATP